MLLLYPNSPDFFLLLPHSSRVINSNFAQTPNKTNYEFNFNLYAKITALYRGIMVDVLCLLNRSKKKDKRVKMDYKKWEKTKPKRKKGNKTSFLLLKEESFHVKMKI